MVLVAVPAGATDVVTPALAHAGQLRMAAERDLNRAEQRLRAARANLAADQALAAEMRAARQAAAAALMEETLVQDRAHEREAAAGVAAARQRLTVRQRAEQQVRDLQQPGRPGTLLFEPDGSVRTLQVGDTVRTGPGETRDVFVGRGARQHHLRLNPDSSLEIEEDSESTFAAHLTHGFAHVRAAIKQWSGKFEVRTPTVVVAVRGTDFAVEVRPDGQRVRVFDGEVAVTPVAGGEAVALSAGMQLDIPASGAWPVPVTFDPAQFPFDDAGAGDAVP